MPHHRTKLVPVQVGFSSGDSLGRLKCLKYLLFKFDRFTVKLKPTNGSKDSVSHTEFWSSAVFGRTEECSREILRSPNDRNA
jgi:hypothetical protein